MDKLNIFQAIKNLGKINPFDSRQEWWTHYIRDAIIYCANNGEMNNQIRYSLLEVLENYINRNIQNIEEIKEQIEKLSQIDGLVKNNQDSLELLSSKNIELKNEIKKMEDEIEELKLIIEKKDQTIKQILETQNQQINLLHQNQNKIISFISSLATNANTSTTQASELTGLSNLLLPLTEWSISESEKQIQNLSPNHC